MDQRTVFLDKIFWSRLYPPLIGVVSQSITISVSLIIIWWLSVPKTLIFDTNMMRQTLAVSIILNGLVNGGILLMEVIYAMKFVNLWLRPIEPAQTIRELTGYVKNNQEGGSYAGYIAPLGLIFVNIIFFVVPYALGETWVNALLNSVRALLPFQLAFLSIHLVKIVLEIIFLLSRNIFQRGRL